MHKYCSPTRSSIQSGRLPYHVNVLNDDMSIWNPQDPVAGFAGIPRNMTTIAMHLKTAGYSTHMRVHPSPSTHAFPASEKLTPALPTCCARALDPPFLLHPRAGKWDAACTQDKSPPTPIATPPPP